MTALRDIHVDRWALSEMLWDRSFGQVRSHQLTFAWTEFDELSGSMLNVFAPKNSVFWGISTYRSASFGHARTARGLLERPSVRESLATAIADIGSARRSVFSFVLMGGLTRFLGDTYMPEDLSDEFFLLERRHFSLFVPHDRIDGVRYYFHAMNQAFGEQSIWAAAEDTCFVVHDRGRAAAPELYKALGSPVTLLSAPEREEAVAVLKGLASIECDEAVRNALLRSTVLAGDVSLALPLVNGESSTSSLLDLLELRALCALRAAPLSVVECLYGELRGRGWRLPQHVELRDKLRGLFLRSLAAIPVVLGDPFEED